MLQVQADQLKQVEAALQHYIQGVTTTNLTGSTK